MTGIVPRGGRGFVVARGGTPWIRWAGEGFGRGNCLGDWDGLGKGSLCGSRGESSAGSGQARAGPVAGAGSGWCCGGAGSERGCLIGPRGAGVRRGWASVEVHDFSRQHHLKPPAPSAPAAPFPPSLPSFPSSPSPTFPSFPPSPPSPPSSTRHGFQTSLTADSVAVLEGYMAKLSRDLESLAVDLYSVRGRGSVCPHRLSSSLFPSLSSLSSSASSSSSPL